MFFQTANHSTEANEVVDYYFADLGISVTANVFHSVLTRRAGRSIHNLVSEPTNSNFFLCRLSLPIQS